MKSRCTIVRQTKVTSQLKLRIQGEEIPSVVDKPIKYLGKWFDKSSGDTINVKEVVERTRLRSKKTNKSDLPGKSKGMDLPA